MGKFYDLSFLRGCCNEMSEHEDNLTFTNRDIKMYLMNKHGQEVSFFVLQEANKSTMVFKECAIQKEPTEIRLEMNRDILN